VASKKEVPNLITEIKYPAEPDRPENQPIIELLRAMDARTKYVLPLGQSYIGVVQLERLSEDRFTTLKGVYSYNAGGVSVYHEAYLEQGFLIVPVSAREPFLDIDSLV